MTPVECRFEEEVLAAVVQSRWPERTDPVLRAHVADCAVCSDLTVVAGALGEAQEETANAMRHQGLIPDSGRVWWVAQRRARREAARTAGRPITVAQVLAFASAVGLLGACFGATSAWFQSALLRLRSGYDWAGLLPSIAGALAEHAVLAVLVVALVFIVPGAVYWVVARD
jgi:hypothetical protein